MTETPGLPRYFELNNGRRIPSVGLGTFQGDAGNNQVRAIVAEALRQGYRHIDTAADYGNELEVGSGIRDSGIKRDDIFVTTKLANNWHEPRDVGRALELSLQRLQLDYGKVVALPQDGGQNNVFPVDLFLMHFPYAYATSEDHGKLRHADGKPVVDIELSRDYPAVWRAMESLVESGKTRAIGLSNFNILKTRRILESARIRPAVNQVEVHPYFPQTALLEFCKAEDIHLAAHQPLGGRPLAVVNPQLGKPGPLADPHIAKIAATNGKSVAQTVLAWNLTRGISVIPKTARVERLSENRELARLQTKQVYEITSLGSTIGPIRYLDPREHVGFDVFDEEHDQPVAILK